MNCSRRGQTSRARARRLRFLVSQRVAAGVHTASTQPALTPMSTIQTSLIANGVSFVTGWSTASHATEG